MSDGFFASTGDPAEASDDFALPAAASGGDDPISAQVAALRHARIARRIEPSRRSGAVAFPSQDAIATAVELLSAALFPRRLGGFRGVDADEDGFVADRLRKALVLLGNEIAQEFAYWQAESDQAFDPDQATQIVRLFAATLADIRVAIDADIDAAFIGDPAARSIDEILICYPGAIAVRYHRIAHQLYALGVPIVARIISELANSRTGIDIHPGATIGRSFFIDHGTGVVIGETAIIGARVKLYQHVTLGARSPLGLSSVGARDRHARHPIVEDDVVIYAGATILGRVRIGRGSTISGNVWLLDDVPAHSVVAQPEATVLAKAPAARLHTLLVGRGH